MRTSIYVLVILTSFLATYVATPLFFPYITGKNFLFRSIVELMLLIYIPLAYLEPKYRPQKSLGLITYSVFIAVIFLADILGVNPSNSLWSNFERMEGFVTHIHLYIFTIVLISIGLSAKEWRKLFNISLIANAVVLVAAFGDYLNILRQNANGQVVGTRLQTMLGNSEYLSIYCAFAIATALLLWVKDKRGFGFAPTTLYGASILFNLFILWQTGTRGTVLGIFAGLGAAILWYGIKHFDNKRIRTLTLSFIGLFLGLILLFVTNRDSAFVQNNYTLKRIADISLQDQTVRSRVLIWNMSWQGVKERPLLGWGQENFVYVFAQKYNPEMFDQEQWFDRSHDVFFDWLVAAGFIGLISYLALFGVLLFTVIKNRADKFSIKEQSVLLGLLTAYFVHNIFVFDSTISYIGFFTIFAYVFGKSVGLSEDKTSKKSTPQTPKYFWMIAAGSIVLVYTSFYYVIYKPFQLNKAIINMYKVAQGGNINTLKDAANRMTVPALYGNGEANEQLLTLSGAVIKANASDGDKKYFYDLAVNTFKDELTTDPLNPRPAVIFAGFAQSIGQYDLAARSFSEALRRTPNKTLLWAEFAKLLVASGKITEAEQAAEKSHALSHRSTQSAEMYAAILLQENKNDLALQTFKDTIAANKNNAQIMANAIGFLLTHGAETQANILISDFAALYPENVTELDNLLKKQLSDNKAK